jgi:hypothetical protein
VLRRIFGRKRDEIIEGCRKLLNEVLHSLYSLPSCYQIKARSIRVKGHVARMEEKINAYRFLMGRKRPLGRHRHRQEDNIKLYLRGIEWGYGLESSGSR